MEWLEIIELRSTVLGNITLMAQLTDILKEINTEQKKDRIKLFSGDTIATDFSIHIEHFSGPPMEKSKLGRHISMVLKNFGLINHKIWVKIENNDSKHQVE